MDKLSSQSISFNKSDENSITICQNVNDRSLDQSVDKSDVVHQSIFFEKPTKKKQVGMVQTGSLAQG